MNSKCCEFYKDLPGNNLVWHVIVEGNRGSHGDHVLVKSKKSPPLPRDQKACLITPKQGSGYHALSSLHGLISVSSWHQLPSFPIFHQGFPLKFQGESTGTRGTLILNERCSHPNNFHTLKLVPPWNTCHGLRNICFTFVTDILFLYFLF